MLTQQVREEDMARVRAVYDRLKINAELAPFFTDLPARLAVEPSRGLALRRRHGGRACAPSAGPRSWCRCPARSTRTSSPMPACCRRPTARSGLRKPNSRRTGWPRKFPRFAAEPARLAAMAAAARSRRPARRRRAAGRSGHESRRNLGRTRISLLSCHGRACLGIHVLNAGSRLDARD